MTDLEKKRQKNLQAIKEFTLMDDTFMTQVFSGNIAATEYVLNIILKNKGLKVIEAVTQMPIANLFGKAVKLDIYATDAENKQYDIEIQRRNEGAVPERARLNSSLFDAKLTHAGQKYRGIPETYVIFITENDVLGCGLPLYTIERTVQETRQLFNDKAHIIYVNGAYRKDDALGQLMQDFHCKDYTHIKSKVLANAVKYYKEEQKGVNEMCDIMERIAAERAAEASFNNAIETALRMIADGQLSLEKVADYSGLSIEKVRELANEKSA